MKKERFIKTFARSYAIALILTLAFTFMPFDVFAASGSYVNDDGDLLSSSEESSLNSAASKIKSETGMDVVFLTSKDDTIADPQGYADTFYDNGGYGEDGVLLYINSNTHDIAISSAGYGITAFTDAGCKYIIDKVSPACSEGSFGKACSQFADLSSDFIKAAKAGKPYDTGHLPKGKLPAVRDLLIALIGGFGFSFLKTSGAKNATTNVVHEATKASYYLTEGSFNLTGSGDQFVSSEIKQKASSSGGGGSTTHTSSSGKTHGGASGKF